MSQTEPDRTDVLVVGAGPTGLTLATALRTRGVRVTVIDRLPEGAIALELMAGREEALCDLRQWAKDGQLAYKTDVRSGFKNLPAVFGELFTGGNDGTLILMVD